jgi:hypothetical protein
MAVRQIVPVAIIIAEYSVGVDGRSPGQFYPSQANFKSQSFHLSKIPQRDDGKNVSERSVP